MKTSATDILQTLQVRSIHVGVMRVELCRSPADLPDRGKRRVVRVKIPALVEGVSRKPGAHAVDLQRFVRRRNIQLQISPSSPGKRRKCSRLGAIWEKLVR